VAEEQARDPPIRKADKEVEGMNEMEKVVISQDEVEERKDR